jgi:predicted phage terminase large subunit-like protein
MTLTPAEQAKQKVELRNRARTDKLFLGNLLGYDFQADVHGDLFAQYIPFDKDKPYFDQHKIKDRLTLWSRGFFKTTSIVVEIVQTILNFPDVSIMLMQSTQKNTQQLLREVKGHFDGSNPNSKLDTLFPEFCRAKLGTAMAFTVPTRQRVRKDPTVFVASPKSVKAGLHPDVGFFDDLVTEVNYRSPELMAKVIEDFGHFVPLINPGGYRYVTGTRYTFGDLYEHIIRQNADEQAKQGVGRWQITIRGCWELRPDGTKVSNFPVRRLADGRTIGISVEMLEAIQRDNPETFSAQYLNRPIAAGKEEFTEAMLMAAVVLRDPTVSNLGPLQAPQPIGSGPALLFVDLASSVKSTADNSVVVCTRQVGGKAVVCDLRSGQWTALQIAEAVIDMAIRQRPIRVLIEGTASSTFFIDYLKVIAKDKAIVLNIEPLKVTNNKDAKRLRISAVAGAIRTGRCAFLAGLPGWADLVQEFCEFPKGRHDDKIDTIGMAVSFYSNQTALYDPLPTQNLPFFLRQAGIDYGLEQKLVLNDEQAWNVIPEPSF